MYKIMPFAARRGRPPKFTRPSRTITVTLPDDVLEALAAFDSDVGRAIVRLAMTLGSDHQHPGVEVATFGKRAVIVVSPTRALSDIAGVELVPLADGRSLIALDDGMSEPQFELAVRDTLDEQNVTLADRALLERLAAVLQDARRTGTLVLRRIIVLHASAGDIRLRNGHSKAPRRSLRP
jgi:hypothetical protein